MSSPAINNYHISVPKIKGIPAEAWAYKLGNRSALEWVLDRYKEKKPKDPTIREKFNTYRFADHKEHVIDLRKRVTSSRRYFVIGSLSHMLVAVGISRDRQGL